MDDNDEVTNDVSEGLRYIADHPEVTNVLLTGGDPLLMSTRRLIEIFDALREIEHVKIIRIGSKMPAFDPWRVTRDAELQAAFRKYSTAQQRIYLMAHFDHPRELTKEAIEGIDVCLKNGVICVNQCPLIKGVNDDPYVLAELYSTLSYILAVRRTTFSKDAQRLETNPTKYQLSKDGISSSRHFGKALASPDAHDFACRTKLEKLKSLPSTANASICVTTRQKISMILDGSSCVDVMTRPTGSTNCNRLNQPSTDTYRVI